jgi:hypothetical protein
MSVTEMEYIRVSDRAAEIGCHVPEIAIMPENFSSARTHNELRVRGEGVTLRSVLESANFPLGSFFPAAERAVFGHENFVAWEASLFVSASLMKREPYAVAVALSIIANHLNDYFKGHAGSKICLTLIVERKRDRTCRKITYEGDVIELRSLAERIGKVADE